jgi:hypothetical protein
MLIVVYDYSKISLPFCKDCRIFCEGVKDDDDAFVKQRPGNYDDNVSNDEEKDNSLVRQINLVSLVGISGFGLIGLIGHSGINNLKGFIGLNGLVSIRGFGLVSLVGLGGFSLVGIIGLSLISHYGLICFIGLGISLIGLGGHSGNISIIGLGNLSIIYIIGQTGLIGPSASSARQLVSLIGFIGLGGHNGLISLVGLSGINGLIGQISLVNSLQFKIEMKPSQQDLFRRESGLWYVWRVFSSLAGLNSAFLNTLLNAKQLFHISLPQMTK